MFLEQILQNNDFLNICDMVFLFLFYFIKNYFMTDYMAGPKVANSS